jgi:hypothetical protein
MRVLHGFSKYSNLPPRAPYSSYRSQPGTFDFRPSAIALPCAPLWIAGDWRYKWPPVSAFDRPDVQGLILTSRFATPRTGKGCSDARCMMLTKEPWKKVPDPIVAGPAVRLPLLILRCFLKNVDASRDFR